MLYFYFLQKNRVNDTDADGSWSDDIGAGYLVYAKLTTKRDEERGEVRSVYVLTINNCAL